MAAELSHERPVNVARFAYHQHCSNARAVTHDHVVVGYFTKGSASMELRGRWTLRAGDVMLVPAGEPHRLVESDQAELWGLGFCVTCFGNEGVTELLEAFHRVRSGASAVVRIPEDRRAFLESLFAELQRETERADSGSLAVQRSLVTLIIAEIERAAPSHEGMSAPDLVAEALRIIEQRCLTPLTLAEVARAVQRSPAHLTTVVRKATGRSVGEWIIAHRLAEARHRLLHTDEIVDVVAERVGYRDPTHFIRMFRRAHGLTPSAWRAKQRQR
ncbi:MAG: AraC family transcriptional regulator [Minicystis sp.]